MNKLYFILVLLIAGCDSHTCNFNDPYFKPHKFVYHHKSKVYEYYHNDAKTCMHDWYCFYYSHKKADQRDFLIYK